MIIAEAGFGFGVKPSSSLIDTFDGFHDFGYGSGLQGVAFRAHRLKPLNGALLFVHADNEYFAGRIVEKKPFSHFQAIELRHIEVQQNNIGLMVVGPGEGSGAMVHLLDYFYLAETRQHGTQAIAKQLMIIHQEDANGIDWGHMERLIE